jgi:hypothetical protein
VPWYSRSAAEKGKIKMKIRFVPFKITYAVAGLASVGAMLAAVACGSPAHPSAACQRATVAADAYARYVRADTTYPNDSVQQGIVIIDREVRLLKAMSRAGCPATTKIVTLPGSAS